MDLRNLQIKKIISHFVNKPDNSGNAIPPIISQHLTTLDTIAKNQFIERLVKVLGNDSKSVSMSIDDDKKDSCFSYINSILQNSSKHFIPKSQDIANKLSHIQNANKNYPSGLLVVIQATVTKSNLNCIIIIKAEEQSAFQKVVDAKTQSILLNLINDLFLSPQSKLYKVGCFIEKNTDNIQSTLNIRKTDYEAILFDANFSGVSQSNAAKYFYHSFLGLSIPESDKIITKRFYETTSDFINRLDLPTEDKISLQNALYTELKTNRAALISPAEFAENYFSKEVQDYYMEELTTNRIPNRGFTKDISQIESVLKLRRFNFSTGVKITAPSDSDLVKVIINKNDIKNINREEFTILQIKGTLSNQ